MINNLAAINNIESADDINYGIDGMVKYFSSPNIRNKIKHPIFLAVRFHEALTLFYNLNLM